MKSWVDIRLSAIIWRTTVVGSVLFHSILVTNFARIEKILDRRGRFLYLVVFVLYYVQITVNAGYNEPLIEVLFLLVPALLVLNTERCVLEQLLRGILNTSAPVRCSKS